MAIMKPQLNMQGGNAPTQSGKGSAALQVTESIDHPGHLYFSIRESWAGEVPPDQSELMIAFENASAVLRSRFQRRSADRFLVYFSRLLKLAQVGFNGPSLQLGMSARGLDQFKAEVVQTEGSQIKHEHLKGLIVAVLWAIFSIMVITILAHLTIRYAESRGWIETVPVEKDKPPDVTGIASQTKSVLLNSIRWDRSISILHFGILLSGTMLGVWLSFSVRSMNLAFEQLQNAEADLMRPWIRLITFGLLALMLALFFQFRVIVVSIGDIFSTSRISDDAVIAFLVGLCLGFSDKVLPAEVQVRVREFFSRAKPSGR
jgi:hypothetical protein